MQESTVRTDIDDESTEKVASPETLSVWGLAWPSILANILYASVGVVALKAVGNFIRNFEIYSSLLEENKELKRALQDMTGWKEKALQLEQKNAQLRALNNVKLSEDLIWVTGE